MSANYIILFLLIGLAVLLEWLTSRSWRANNPFVRWIGTILGGLLTLVTVFISIQASIGIFRYYNPEYHPVPNLTVEGTAAQIERGRHLASAFCVECHSQNSLLMASLYKHIKQETQAKQGFLNAAILSEGYVIGANRLLVARDEMRSNIASATVQLRLALSELEERNLDLEDQRKRAQAASEAKSRFLANIATKSERL